LEIIWLLFQLKSNIGALRDLILPVNGSLS
jgi:hypothetical protein